MNMITPTKEDMMRMVRAFVSVHQDNVKDDIGPNKPDAPFFERVAKKDEMDEEDYMEMSERLYKYIRTQVPTIMAIAGYPPETDWPSALDSLYRIGEQAKAVREAKEAEEQEYKKLYRQGEGMMYKLMHEHTHGQGYYTQWNTISEDKIQGLYDSLIDMGILKDDATIIIEDINKKGQEQADNDKDVYTLTAEQ